MTNFTIAGVCAWCGERVEGTAIRSDLIVAARRAHWLKKAKTASETTVEVEQKSAA